MGPVCGVTWGGPWVVYLLHSFVMVLPSLLLCLYLFNFCHFYIISCYFWMFPICILMVLARFCFSASLAHTITLATHHTGVQKIYSSYLCMTNQHFTIATVVNCTENLVVELFTHAESLKKYEMNGKADVFILHSSSFLSSFCNPLHCK